MSIEFLLDKSSDLQLELSTVTALCHTIDTPRSLTVLILIQNKEWQQLLELSCDPSNYEDVSNFADDYLVTEILKKSQNLPLGIDRRKAALTSFYESEEHCRSINDRLLKGGPEPDYVHRTRRFLHRLLGPLSKRDLAFAESSFRFGPGATTAITGRGSVLSDKYDEEIHLTASLYPFYRAVLGDTWWENSPSPVVVEGNRFTTVPKNAKTDRGICIEPTLNIYVQLGIGALLRRRLRRIGIDLTDQTRNQELARRAYSESLATIDLSAASDTVSFGVVLDLLPRDWFELLELPRCPFTVIDGKRIELEKFSSMGNGYTFELETLIFSSVVFSTVPRDQWHLCSVYGDDIICPQHFAPAVVETLNFLGFKVNLSKSFLAGSFFESCGSDWFKGQNVRPFFLRKSSKEGTPYCVQIANALRLYARRRLLDLGCDGRFLPLWKALIRLAPSAWKGCLVPISFGDAGIISSYEECKPSRAWATEKWPEHEGFVVQYMRMKPIYRRKRSIGRLLAALACPVTRIASQGREPKRGYLRRPSTRVTIVSQWSHGLSWVL